MSQVRQAIGEEGARRQRIIDISLAWMKENPSSMPKPLIGKKYPTIKQIKWAVCEHFQVCELDLVSDRRYSQIIIPRQVAMFLCRKLTPSSYPAIAREFRGRDHTTILNGVRKIESMIQTVPELASIIRKIESKLEPST